MRAVRFRFTWPWAAHPAASAEEADRAGARPIVTQPALRVLLVVVGVVVVLLALVRLLGSPLATAWANHKLAHLGNAYTGHVRAATLELWRGGGTVDEFSLTHRGNEGDLPIVRVKHASMVFAWSSILHGRLGGSAIMDGVELNLVKREQFAGPTDAAQRLGAEAEEKKEDAQRWQDILQQTFPMEISRVEVRSGRVSFVDRTHQPNVEVALEQMHVEMSGLRNRPAAEGALPASVTLEGVTTGNGKLQVRVSADPVSDPFRFDAAMQLRELELPPVNSFLLAYTGTDVSRGSFDLDMEIHAANGGYQGYTKPFFRDLDFRNVSDENKPLGKRLAETAASAVSGLLKNKDTEKVATRAPFSGSFENGSVDLWTTVSNLLRNAFVQALREGFEGQKPTQ